MYTYIFTQIYSHTYIDTYMHDQLDLRGRAVAYGQGVCSYVCIHIYSHRFIHIHILIHTCMLSSIVSVLLCADKVFVHTYLHRFIHIHKLIHTCMISSILAGALLCAEKVGCGTSVLLHCSDGWDRTPQISGVLQGVAGFARCCSVLQCVAVCAATAGIVRHRSQVCWRVLQGVAECCSVLQCVAVCCSVRSDG